MNNNTKSTLPSLLAENVTPHKITKQQVVTSVDDYLKKVKTHFTLLINDFHATQPEINEVITTLASATKKDTIEIHIASNGGSMPEGLQYINMVNSKFKQSNITIYVNHAYSMGAIMLAAFKDSKRIAYSNSTLMIHSPTLGLSAKQHEINQELIHKNKWIGDIYLTYLTPFFNKQEIKQIKSGKDIWLTSKQMLEKGLIDKIK